MVKNDGCELFEASEREHYYLMTHFGATWSKLMDVSFSLLFEASRGSIWRHIWRLELPSYQMQ